MALGSLILFLDPFIFSYVCECSCLCSCMHTLCMPSARRGQERALESRDGIPQVVVNHLVLFESSRCAQALSLLSSIHPVQDLRIHVWAAVFWHEDFILFVCVCVCACVPCALPFHSKLSSNCPCLTEPWRVRYSASLLWASLPHGQQSSGCDPLD